MTGDCCTKMPKNAASKLSFFPWRPAGGRSSTSAADVDDVEIVADVDYLEGSLESRPLRDI